MARSIGPGFLRRIVTVRRLLILLGVVALAYYPYTGPSSFTLHLGSLFFIWAIVASYWNLLNGYAGIISLGNMGFMALGAYTSAVMANELGLSPWLTMGIGALVSAILVTIFLGLPVLRLRGIYIALLTLVFADALPSLISVFREWTGGGIGLLGIPTLLPEVEEWQAYYIAMVFFLAAHAVLYAIIKGKTGLAFVALRDSEEFAVALGVDRFREGVKVFAISAFVTGLAGGLFAHLLGVISPGMLGIEQFLMVVAMWLLGGVGTFFGPIIGAAVITFGGEYLRVLGTVRLGLFGGLIVLTVLFFPGGVMQLLGALGRRARSGWRWVSPERGRGRTPVPTPTKEEVPVESGSPRAE